MTGDVAVFSACPELAYCQLDHTVVFGQVDAFRHCPLLHELDLRHSRVVGTTDLLRVAAPSCNPRGILSVQQRLDED